MSSRLTKVQREALDRLTPKRRTFALAFCGEAAGNGTEAARIAEYANPAEEAYRLLRNDHVMAAIEAMTGPREERAIATLDELRERWSTMALTGRMVIATDDGETRVPLEPKDVLKAGELLAKTMGAFVDRKEVSGPGGGPIEQQVRAVVMAGPVADDLAPEPPRLASGDDGADVLADDGSHVHDWRDNGACVYCDARKEGNDER